MNVNFDRNGMDSLPCQGPAKGSDVKTIDEGERFRHDRYIHVAIIASLLLLAAGCGYKTDPVYVPPTEQNLSQGVAR